MIPGSTSHASSLPDEIDPTGMFLPPVSFPQLAAQRGTYLYLFERFVPKDFNSAYDPRGLPLESWCYLRTVLPVDCGYYSHLGSCQAVFLVSNASDSFPNLTT